MFVIIRKIFLIIVNWFEFQIFIIEFIPVLSHFGEGNLNNKQILDTLLLKTVN